MLSRRSLPVCLLKRQAKPIVWCASGSRTYLTITITSPFPSTPQASVLFSALSQDYKNITEYQSQNMDVVIGHPMQYVVGSVDVRTWDAGGHNTTWGVLGAAYKALGEFVQYFDFIGGLDFDIYDGLHQVGAGNVTWIEG